MNISELKKIISHQAAEEKLEKMNSNIPTTSFESDYWDRNTKSWVHCSKKMQPHAPYTIDDAYRQIEYEHGWDDVI